MAGVVDRVEEDTATCEKVSQSDRTTNRDGEIRTCFNAVTSAWSIAICVVHHCGFRGVFVSAIALVSAHRSSNGISSGFAVQDGAFVLAVKVEDTDAHELAR